MITFFSRITHPSTFSPGSWGNRERTVFVSILFQDATIQGPNSKTPLGTRIVQATNGRIVRRKPNGWPARRPAPLLQSALLVCASWSAWGSWLKTGWPARRPAPLLQTALLARAVERLGQLLKTGWPARRPAPLTANPSGARRGTLGAVAEKWLAGQEARPTLTNSPSGARRGTLGAVAEKWLAGQEARPTLTNSPSGARAVESLGQEARPTRANPSGARSAPPPCDSRRPVC